MFVYVNKLQRLKQKKRSVDGYSREFCTVAIRAGLVKDSEEKAGVV